MRTKKRRISRFSKGRKKGGRLPFRPDGSGPDPSLRDRNEWSDDEMEVVENEEPPPGPTIPTIPPIARDVHPAYLYNSLARVVEEWTDLMQGLHDHPPENEEILREQYEQWCWHHYAYLMSFYPQDMNNDPYEYFIHDDDDIRAVTWTVLNAFIELIWREFFMSLELMDALPDLTPQNLMMWHDALLRSAREQAERNPELEYPFGNEEEEEVSQVPTQGGRLKRTRRNKKSKKKSKRRKV